MFEFWMVLPRMKNVAFLQVTYFRYVKAGQFFGQLVGLRSLFYLNAAFSVIFPRPNRKKKTRIWFNFSPVINHVRDVIK